MPTDVRKGRLRSSHPGAAQLVALPWPPACCPSPPASPLRAHTSVSAAGPLHLLFSLSGSGFPFWGFSFFSLPSLPLVSSHLSESEGSPTPVTLYPVIFFFVMLPPLPRFTLCMRVNSKRREDSLFTWPPHCRRRGWPPTHECQRALDVRASESAAALAHFSLLVV